MCTGTLDTPPRYGRFFDGNGSYTWTKEDLLHSFDISFDTEGGLIPMTLEQLLTKLIDKELALMDTLGIKLPTAKPDTE